MVLAVAVFAAGAPASASAKAQAPTQAELLAKFVGADPSNLWSVVDSTAAAMDPYWDEQRGGYVINGTLRTRVNSEMLLVHSYAALAGQKGPSSRPERIAKIVQTLVGPLYVPTIKGKISPRPGGGAQPPLHAPGWRQATTETAMHPSLDAVVARALGVAWQTREIAGFSEELKAEIARTVSTVAYSPFWRYSGRLLNQINWNADIYFASATITGKNGLMLKDYRNQLQWLLSHARKTAYPGGTTNFTSGLGFHYLPNRVDRNRVNLMDTAEYGNITLGALAYFDRARAMGMRKLRSRDTQTMRAWVKRVTYGNWTSSGYMNWDSGRGIDRVHLTQYWLLALRGLGSALLGSANAGSITNQRATANWLTQRAVAHYQRRATDAGTINLPATDFGFTGSNLISNRFDGSTSTARFASTIAELAQAGIAGMGTAPLPSAASFDSDIGRLAVTTGNYSAAVLAAPSPRMVSGLEPSRILNNRGQALTSIGGSRDSTIGFRVLDSAKHVLLDTQAGAKHASLSPLSVSSTLRDRAKTFRSPVMAKGSATGTGLSVSVQHAFTGANITTKYTIFNARKSTSYGQLRIPTFNGSGGSLRKGQKFDAASLKSFAVTTSKGATFNVAFGGLPADAKGAVSSIRKETFNPLPGPSLKIKYKLPPGKSVIKRVVTIPPF